MTAENFESVFKAHLSKRPFTVFTVELHGGQRYEIDGPMAAMVRDGMCAFFAPGGMPVWFDHDSVNQIFTVPANDAPPIKQPAE